VLVLSGLGAFVYGTAYFIHAVVLVSEHPFPAKDNLGLFLIDLDMFLIGATLLIIAVGFYALSFDSGAPDADRPPVPRWLDVRDLDDMKVRIIAMLVLISLTTFVDLVVDFHGGRDILFLGAAVALVIAAVTLFLAFGSVSHRRT
jgi:uncharacterized membrane protein YqhA